MTKAQLVSSIASDTRLSKNDVLTIIESFIKNVTKALTTDGKVTLVGFGSFSARQRKAREGRNPRTGDVITIPAARVPKFVPGSALKEALIIKEPVKIATKETKKKKEPAPKIEPAKLDKKTKKSK
ncbi:MAG: HU family DNA-binding protein [Nitrospirae bacterium]|nr:HU family DNA-binding protein [Nitrospirota bacterium]